MKRTFATFVIAFLLSNCSSALMPSEKQEQFHTPFLTSGELYQSCKTALDDSDKNPNIFGHSICAVSIEATANGYVMLKLALDGPHKLTYSPVNYSKEANDWLNQHMCLPIEFTNYGYFDVRKIAENYVNDMEKIIHSKKYKSTWQSTPAMGYLQDYLFFHYQCASHDR